MDRKTYHYLRKLNGSEQLNESLGRLRRNDTADVHYAINERGAYERRLARVVEDGKVGVVRSGMDCDCTQYHRSTIQEIGGLYDFVRQEHHHYDSLDGYESTSFVRPSESVVEYRSRDLAMEAYEDGHPSTVYTVAYDELYPR